MQHDVWLSEMAIDIIHEQMADADRLAERKDRKPCEFVFPAPGGETAISAAAISKALKRLERPGGGTVTILGVAPFTPHDLRRTMATLCEEIGISPLILGHALNHLTTTKATTTTSVYGRYDYSREKKEVFDKWAERLAAIISGKAANVVPIAAASRS